MSFTPTSIVSEKPADILHLLNLDTVGGVEHLFHHFVTFPHKTGDQTDHAIITGGPVHPHFEKALKTQLAGIHYAKTWHGMKLPKRPRFIRRWRQDRLIRQLDPDLGVLWNRFGDLTSLEGLKKHGVRVIHYEHGAAWLAPKTPRHEQFLGGVDLAVCASVAAKRVLQLRWGYAGKIEVVLNCLRPDLVPGNQQPKSLPEDRPVRLGVAARLIPLKGVGVALHALRTLLDAHHTVELHIAGGGPLQPFLAQETNRLGLDAAVTFHGCIQDMPAFYEMIDLLLVPSVREPFGLVIVEAAARGCPAVCSRIDGIPEAVVDGQTGVCLSPTVDLASGLRFGGEASEFPPGVYDPQSDQMVEPRFLAPDLLAGAIAALLGDPETYARLSGAAIEHAKENFSTAQYVADLRHVFARALKAG